MSGRTFAEDALIACADITRCIMSAEHEDHEIFTRALRANNALGDYFSAIRKLEQLAPAGKESPS